MLNQSSAEAVFSATYVENYLDCVENLPNDLQRQLSRIRELDVAFRDCMRDVESHLAACTSAGLGPEGDRRRVRAAVRLQTALVTAQDIGDEKLQLVQLIQDLIDNKSRQLDTDHRKLVSCVEVTTNGTVKEEQSLSETSRRIEDKESNIPLPALQPQPDRPIDKDKEKNDKDKTSGERWSKRARRTRTATSTNANDGADSGEKETVEHRSNSSHNTATQKKGIGKKKKRKARQAAQRSETPPEEMDTIDPDEPRYCLCDQISFGEMILCDNDLCPIEWFHFSCVCLTTKPKGKWFCPKCRGDRPNVMKPKGQFLKELEKYNKEKEEKA